MTSRRWLLANKRECQAGNDEGQQKDRQEPFPVIGSWRFRRRRRRRSWFGSSFGRCGLSGCDVPVRLTSRTCRSFRATRTLPSSTTSYVPRRTSAPIALCVSFSVAVIVDVFWFVKGCFSRRRLPSSERRLGHGAAGEVDGRWVDGPAEADRPNVAAPALSITLPATVRSGHQVTAPKRCDLCRSRALSGIRPFGSARG